MLQLLYNISGWFPEMLYNVIKGWGGQKFQIFALYNMCTLPLPLYMNIPFRSNCMDPCNIGTVFNNKKL